MNEATGNKKAISLVCLIGGLVLLIWSLALDFMGTKAGYRGTLLVVGIIGIIAGLYLLPTLKYHRTLIYVIFLFPLLFAFAVTVIIPLFLGLFFFPNLDTDPSFECVEQSEKEKDEDAYISFTRYVNKNKLPL